MNKCIYEPIHGSYPNCNGACKTGPDKHCPYYFIDDIWETMAQWKREAHVDTPIMWKFDRERNKMCVYTTRPGYLIGYHGGLVEKYRALLKERAPDNECIQKGIELIEVDDCIE